MKKKQAGYYEIHFNASELTSGVYFYKLTANRFYKCKKDVINKIDLCKLIVQFNGSVRIVYKIIDD